MGSLSFSEAAWSCDTKSAYQRLAEQSSLLFSSELDQVTSWLSPDADGNRIQHKLQTCHILNADLVLPANTNSDIYYFVPQAHSRDRLRVTKKTFEKIIRFHNVFPYFLETVQAFGIRTQDESNTWHNFHCRESSTGAEVEICYTLRFFERNGRSSGDPWSQRQTGIYHQTMARTSIWILIKASPHLKDRLEEKLGAISHYDQFHKARHLFLHIVILAFSLQNWREYIATQRSKTEEFEEKSLFSEVDQTDPNDYKLGFEDRQSLQRLRRKLIKAAAVLDAGIHLAQKLKGVLEKMSIGMVDSVMETISHELEDLQSEFEYDMCCIKDLQQRSSDTATLLLDILERRFGNATLRSAIANEASQRANVESLKTMMTIAMNGEMEHELEQKTSINIRALTVVATLYLPASLLAGVFSSNLVDVDPNSNHFVVSSEFWKFVVIMIPMIVVTLGLVIVLQAVWTRKHQVELNEIMEKKGTDTA